jgi:hypothetical protein
MAKLDPSKSIPTASSKSENWIVWHKDLKKMFGKKKANSIWLYAWAKRGGVNSPANTTELRKEMEGQGVNITTTTLGDLTDTIGDVLGFGLGIGKIVIIGGLSITGLILLGILVKLFRNPNQQLNLTALPVPPQMIQPK